MATVHPVWRRQLDRQFAALVDTFWKTIEGLSTGVAENPQNAVLGQCTSRRLYTHVTSVAG